ncbi:hypothetical protein [Streptomyces sp. DH24]|uniref:hypothetical protein n=1 Tax=Streptomyces sp. DH24 TaxID=3040123 RepID=UPI002441F17F|nr:hypothetical protein [Streptomyces sp. DH24]MDG9719487.1 hypothetical protein [Streptomyces sp. DH24]
MIAQPQEKTAARRPETGWSRARRLRGRNALRTWVPAVADRDLSRGADGVPEGNIVRGED